MTHKPKLLSLVLSLSVLAIITYAVVSIRGGGFDFRRKAYQGGQGSGAEADAGEVTRNLTLELIKSINPSGAAATDLSERAGQRKAAAKRLLRENPAEFLKIAVPASLNAKMAEPARAGIETEATAEGLFEVVHFDNPEAKQSKTEYYLRTGGNERLQLFFGDQDRIPPPQSKISVTGFRLDDLVAVPATNEKFVKVLEKARPITIVDKKVAVFLFNFSNNNEQPWTVDEVRGWTFTGQYSANNYYREASFGKWKLSGKLRSDGDVFGWFKIPTDNTGCRYYEWPEMVKQQAKSQGIDIEGYDNYIYAFPYSSCWASGWAEIGGKNLWIDGSYNSYKNYLVIHELGHNFGAHHANFYYCVDDNNRQVPISADCKSWEYGDGFDVMGGGATYHMNDFHKAQVGWLTPANIKDITKDGIFTLYPIEQPPKGNRTLSLRIPRTKNTDGSVKEYYYVEFRRPLGLFDNFPAESAVVNGVTIRLAPPISERSQSQLIDTVTDDGNGNNQDAPLIAGRTFSDDSRGITFSKVKATAQKAKVKIEFKTPKCVRAKPKITLYPLGQWGKPGEQAWYWGSIKNNDSYGCQAATFSLEPTLLSGWTQSVQPTNSFMLIPEEETHFSLAVRSTSSTPAGYYTFTETAVHSGGRKYSAAVAANLNIYTLDLEPPQIRIYSPLSGARVSGQVNIRAEAADNIAMNYTEFFLDNSTSLGKSWSGSKDYTIYWDSTTAADGEHSFSAEAVDISGNSARSAAVTVIAQNQTPSPSPTPTASVSATPKPTRVATPPPTPTPTP